MKKSIDPKVAAIVVILAVVVLIGGAFLLKGKGGKEEVNVKAVARKELTEQDKAKLRAGWTYDVHSKQWLDENFRPVPENAAPPTQPQ